MEHPFSRRNFIQNLVIGLLLCSALTLFVQIQMYNLGETTQTYLSRMLGITAITTATESSFDNQMSSPVAVAVSASFGRYGSPHISTQDEAFAPLGTLLGQGLSALSATALATNEATFAHAVDGTSIYFDFLVPLPSTVIAGLLGVSQLQNQTQMRRLVLCVEDEDMVMLYWWDGEDTYAYTPTDIDPITFYAVQEDYQADNVFFAFEGETLSSALTRVDPFSLFSTTTATYPLLTVTTPDWNETSLLTQLGFNPYTNSRYAETSGTEVILQGDDIVYLLANGGVSYVSDGTSKQVVLPATQTTSSYELASGASQLLQSLLGSMAGEASLAISAFSQEGTTTYMSFDYELNGIPIVFSHGEPAATITLEGTVVTQLTLYPRQYYQNDTSSLLLPLEQATAVAVPGANLALNYVDYYTGSVSAMWIYK